VTDFEKISVRFPSAGGSCVADLYLTRAERPAPVVVMAHGIGADRSFGLARYAERFAAAGLAALVFDYRGFGESPGTPRRLVSPRAHVEDYRSALRFVRSDDRLDGQRIGLWGTSFSGGHVLVVSAGEAKGVRAVVAQVPFVSGISSSLAYPLRYQLPALALGLADGLAGLVGRGPITVPVVRERGFALLAAPDAFAGYRALVPDDAAWPIRVPARVFLRVLGYHPIRRAPRVRVPTLVLAGTRDALCPIGAVRRAARRIEDCRFEAFPIGHFDGYEGEWVERFVTLQISFFQEHLSARATRPES
jgi:pimeloyl-ACP methyl ester carboxylesterase